MTELEKKAILALIDGLAKVKGQTQYTPGQKVIDEEGIKVLKGVIQKM